MTALITDGPDAALGATSRGAKPSKKPPVRERRAHVALAKGKSAKKGASPKKASKSDKKAGSARDGSKTAQVENYRLAGALGARLFVGHSGQENGFGGRLD
jgi:hypothetical protein